MKDITVDGTRFRATVRNDAHVANALRRALMSDVDNCAAKHVVIRANTSCQTDEYIAHRIAMIPFVCDGAADVARRKLTLRVTSRDAMASDFGGDDGVAPAYGGIPIIALGPEQTLDLDVAFERGTGAAHAKFSHVGAVSYRVDDQHTAIGFSTFEGVDPVDYVERALRSLVRRVDAAIFFVETHDDDEKAAAPQSSSHTCDSNLSRSMPSSSSAATAACAGIEGASLWADASARSAASASM